MVAFPLFTPVASPFEPEALLIVAALVFEELHVTAVVKFWVVPSEYVPVAVNCLVVPLTIEGLAGVIAIEARVAGVTVSVADFDTLPAVAVIVVVPTATEVASPFDPAALLIVATPTVLEVQVTVLVRFCVDPSEYVPVAVNCVFVPSAMLGFVGLSAKDTSVAGVTVKLLCPVIPLN